MIYSIIDGADLAEHLPRYVISCIANYMLYYIALYHIS